MLGWLNRNHGAVEALAATITATVAVGALIGVSIQLEAADTTSRAASAREAYRAHLSLTVANPQFNSYDTCANMTGPDAPGYFAYVDHLLYAAEQMLAVADGWEETFLTQLEPHAGYICGPWSPGEQSDQTAALIARFAAETCSTVQACPVQ